MEGWGSSDQKSGQKGNGDRYVVDGAHKMREAQAYIYI